MRRSQWGGWQGKVGLWGARVSGETHFSVGFWDTSLVQMQGCLIALVGKEGKYCVKGQLWIRLEINRLRLEGFYRQNDYEIHRQFSLFSFSFSFFLNLFEFNANCHVSVHFPTAVLCPVLGSCTALTCFSFPRRAFPHSYPSFREEIRDILWFSLLFLAIPVPNSLKNLCFSPQKLQFS